MTRMIDSKTFTRTRIAYGIIDSPLDRLLLAATQTGICFLALGDDDGKLHSSLEREFPKAAALTPDADAVQPGMTAVLELLDGRRPDASLSLDVRATAFQRHVWQTLRAIPAGQTRSYGDLAAQLGLPGGQRAVARACAANPVAVIVPCHRVLRADGGLGGYRWGVARKTALLARERGSN